MQFKVNAKDWKRALKLLLVNRDASQDCIDFNLDGRNLTLTSTGAETEFEVDPIVLGHARVPCTVLKKVNELLPTFKKDELDIKIEKGRFKLESFGVSDPAIDVPDNMSRIIDLPVNASTLDTLAVAQAFSAREIEESGLNERVWKARHDSDIAIDGATQALGPLDMPREAVVQIVNEQIRQRAKAFKAAGGKLGS